MSRLLFIFFIVLSLSCSVCYTQAMTDTTAKVHNEPAMADSANYVEYIGVLPSGTRHIYIGKGININVDEKAEDNDHDTLKKLFLFNGYYWDVAITYYDGRIEHLQTKIPDTIGFHGIKQIAYSALLHINPALLYKTTAIEYEINGSFSISLNSENLLSTGDFVNQDANTSLAFSNANLLFFSFKDTVARLELSVMPYKVFGEPKVRLWLMQKEEGEYKLAMLSKTENKFYALGFYFMAFGLIFMFIYLFYKRKRENLYFSLFCLVIVLLLFIVSYMMANIGKFDNFIFIIVVCVLFAMALEMLSFFLFAVIRNRERKKRMLTIIGVLTLLLCASIFFLYHSNFDLHYVKYILNVLIVCSIVILMIKIISVIVTLIRGFWQKSWEAKTITGICSVTALISLILPIVFNSAIKTYETNNPNSHLVFDNLLLLSCFIYPLSVAIVLGRRNGMNQTQLVNQIEAIENLSAESLEKEREKQEILENQNIQLEQKVEERTEEVMRQKKLTEQKNKEITDNINYALRIQSAILPDIKLIYKTLEQSFILYLPKDIVSGDFYAFSEKDGKAIIIAGDCTGHGVSGAFMSMIGNSLLNHVINEKGITDPALILNELNRNVIETLHQSEQESHDGMDVSVCAFDLTTNQLQFAGANRPLWLIRNHELIVFKPNKYPIGGLQMAIDRTFTENQITIQKNDALYIFSDGYADQFGGGNGKKMMTSRFKEVLLSIQNLSMREQEVFLKDYFEKWKGENEQVDDVLVIGVRV